MRIFSREAFRQRHLPASTVLISVPRDEWADQLDVSKNQGFTSAFFTGRKYKSW
jgi:hypothetical protein